MRSLRVIDKYTSSKIDYYIEILRVFSGFLFKRFFAAISYESAT